MSRARELAPTKDTYIGVLLHSKKDAEKASCLAGYWLWADIDGATDSAKLDELGAMVVASGRAGHVHVYVQVAEQLPDWRTTEVWNRRLAKWLGADAKWHANAVLRLAGTHNHKPDGGPVRIERQASRSWTLEELGKILPELPESSTGAGEAPGLPDFAPLPNEDHKYFWSFFNIAKDEVPDKGTRGPGGEDRSRSGRTHWFEQRCAEIGLEPGQIRTAVHHFGPAKDKESDEPGWIDHDFLLWLRDEWPKFKDAKFNKDVEEAVYRVEVQRTSHRIVDAKEAAAGFDPPPDLYFTLKDELEDHDGVDGKLFDGTV